MDYTKKYLKYKNKYISLKRDSQKDKNKLLGGVYKVGTEVGKKVIDKLIDSNLTLINAHGGIIIDKWYALPENVYLLTTSDIGGTTCANYNEIFRELINDTNDRVNLKNILSIVSTSINNSEDEIVSTQYKHGNMIYEPGDLIPIINFSFKNSKISNSAETIYGLFNFDPINTEDHSKNKLLKEYVDLLETNSGLEIKKNDSFKLCTKFNKNKLIEIIQNINKKSVDLELAFKKFLLDEKYKKYFIEPESLDFDKIRNNEDNKFLSMIMTLLYKSEIDINKYEYDIKYIIDKLDKSKVNLIILCSCLHAKNVYMRIYEKCKEIPSSLEEYNNKAKCTQIADEYFSNPNFLPIYSLTKEEKDYVKQFMDECKNYNEADGDVVNKTKIKKITELLKNEITLNGLLDKENTEILLNTLLYDCIIRNNCKIIELLRNNFNSFPIENLVNVLKKILSELNETNSAFIEFFKINDWHQESNINIEYETLYSFFESKRKISLWDVLIINKFKWYKYDDWNTWNSTTIIDKLVNDTEIRNEKKIELINLYYNNNNNEKLLTYIIENSYNINEELISELMKLETLILLNINKNNLNEILKNIYNDQIFKLLIEIFKKNNFYDKSAKEITELLICLLNNAYNYDIEKIKIITPYLNSEQKNESNDNGYNLYSYIIASHQCSIIITQKNDYMSQEVFDKEIKSVNEKFENAINFLKENNFTNNGRILDLSKLPTSLKSVGYKIEIDGVECKSCIG